MKSLKILYFFDLGTRIPKNQNFRENLHDPGWEDDLVFVKTLESLGHEVELFGLHDQIEELVSTLKNNPPDLIFNQCESFKLDRKFEAHIVSLFELFEIPYTGANPETLTLCKDKGLSKKILSYHKLRVPKFLLSEKTKPLKNFDRMPWPCIVKPLDLEASEGISLSSLVHDAKEAQERVQFIHEKYQCNVILEEFIEGRELYVGVLGDQRVQVLSPRELFFGKITDEKAKFATYRTKWDEAYRKKWGIDSDDADELDPKVLREIQTVAKKIFHVFKMRGYARVDFRLTSQNELVFLEANPNPSLGHEDDFVLSAKKDGLEYDKVLAKIIRSAMKNQEEKDS